MPRFARSAAWVAVAAVVWAAPVPSQSFAASAEAPINLPSPAPAEPQPDAAQLADGLAVRYHFNRFTHIDELEEWMRYDDGMAGEPLPTLDYSTGIGNVLTSGSSDLVGADISGLIRMPKPGTYTFRITSNDGVRLSIGGVQMHEDPEIHPDTTSPPLVMEVAEPGWYPIEILYYEKKGTAALRLAWQPPGAEEAEPVPASVLKHQRDQ